jgi:putative colanic acid biosynthesis acetyltransferase WcaF
MQNSTDLSTFNNSSYRPGGGLKRGVWYVVNALLFNSAWFPFSNIKCQLLRIFGASVGHHVVIKPSVNIKYPWFLDIRDHVWIGENVWIDNLGIVEIGAHSCLSQGAMLLSGNHNFKRASFDLIVAPIKLAEGVWIGAKAVVCPGVICETHSVLTVGSVATGRLKGYSIYQGNPAKMIKEREIH